MKRRKWKIKNFEYKRRYFIFVTVLLFLLFFSFFLVNPTLGSYRSEAPLSVNSKYAFYLFKEGTFSFNIELDGIVPSDTPYKTTFSLANYEKDQRSDVDLSYTVSLRSTTNLPLRYELHRQSVGSMVDNTNIISETKLMNDADGAWYYQFQIPYTYTFSYRLSAKDIYELVIYFPKSYASMPNYADQLEHIEVTIDSKQIIS